jgi:hypothetical protein
MDADFEALIAKYDRRQLVEIRRKIAASRDERHAAIRRALTGDIRTCAAILDGHANFRSEFDQHLLDRFEHLLKRQ